MKKLLLSILLVASILPGAVAQNCCQNEKSTQSTACKSVGQEPTQSCVRDRDEREVVFENVDVKASFPGGEEEMYKFITSHWNYNDDVCGQQGAVFVRFVVGRDGSISDAEVVRSVTDDLDREALRLVGLLPKFEPALKNGHAATSFYTLRIAFWLENQSNKEIVYDEVDTPASFPGGEKELYKVIKSKMRFPNGTGDMRRNADVRFVVNSDGSIGDIEVTNKATQVMIEESNRIIKSLPKFTPAQRNGLPVASWYEAVIWF